MNKNNISAGVIMPFWTDGAPDTTKYLKEAIDSILKQSSPHWRLYIVDDASDPIHTEELFANILKLDSRIIILSADINMGPGNCRNIGIEKAASDNCYFISFLDSDDISNEYRIETALSHFHKNAEIDICYSGFIPIDENGADIKPKKMIEGMRLLYEQLKSAPLIGEGLWRTVFRDRDGLTIPSSLNVRTDIAQKIPFTSEFRFHEDTHAWVRYSAYGAKFSYIEGIESRYRLLNNGQSSESRKRAGGINCFNEIRYEVGLDSLEQSIDLAKDRENMSEYEQQDLRRQYYRSLGEIIKNEGSLKISERLFDKASLIDAAID
jgi:glycosyltransferase involved in cell wall biosynthesis